MSTFEGPLLSIKSVNALAHYTDWIIGHVHGGTLGWNGFMIFGMIYYLVPKLWRTELYSKSLATTHFWLGTLGILLYMMSMWVAGITQGLMLRAVDAQGQLLYPDFIETVVRIVPMYHVRLLGGLSFFVGFLIMVYNIWLTIARAPASAGDETVMVTPTMVPAGELKKEGMHRALEGLPFVFTLLIVGGVLVGSIISLVPTMLLPMYADSPTMIRPYSALELAGRDLYIREGCYLCHSQEIRTLVTEVMRYGEASRPEESAYDHPFQWGSKRTGPDLARVGKKYPDLWHYRHMMDPRAVTPKSLMPTYGWFATDRLDFDSLPKKLSVMKKLGVPYKDFEISHAIDAAKEDAKRIADGLTAQGAPAGLEDKEIVALIAYLQSLGQTTLKTSAK